MCDCLAATSYCQYNRPSTNNYVVLIDFFNAKVFYCCDTLYTRAASFQTALIVSSLEDFACHFVPALTNILNIVVFGLHSSTEITF